MGGKRKWEKALFCCMIGVFVFAAASAFPGGGLGGGDSAN